MGWFGYRGYTTQRPRTTAAPVALTGEWNDVFDSDNEVILQDESVITDGLEDEDVHLSPTSSLAPIVPQSYLGGNWFGYQGYTTQRPKTEDPVKTFRPRSR